MLMYRYILTAAFAAVLALPAFAQASDDAAHEVSVEVATVRSISVGADLGLTLAAPSAGDTDLTYTGSSTYGVITNATGDVITASVSGLPTSGLSLSATYGAPSGATGGTDVGLSAAATNVVTGVSQVSASGLSIAYTATAALDLAPGTYDLDVTYTVTAP